MDENSVKKEECPTFEEKANNLENIVKQQHLLAHYTVESLLTLDELFEVLEKNFVEYHNKDKLKELLPFIHLNLRLFVRRDYNKYDIGMALYEFYERHNDVEDDIAITVQIIHQFLFSLNIYDDTKGITVARKVFAQLAKCLTNINERKLIVNIIACIQLYTKTYKGNDDLYQLIWTALKSSSMSEKAHVDIFIQLFDEFSTIQPNLYIDLGVIETVQSLLKSQQRDERKCGYYLFKKIINCFTLSSKNANNILFSSEYAQQIERSWMTYITILENLEENQSHLILPSLQNLDELIAGKQLQSSWMDILFSRIIIHKNNQVLRWSLEYFMTTFTSSDLNVQVLKELLEACNTNVLYNCEGYFLDRKYFCSFLKGDLTNLYTLLGDVNWKSVPLHNLLSILEENEVPKSLTNDQVLKVASRVRALQDYHIRKDVVILVNRLFEDIVEDMTLMEYIVYVEMLCNATDKLNVFEQLYKKITKNGVIVEIVDGTFKGRFYEILVNNIEDTTPVEFTNFLKQIPMAKHGWLKFLPFHFNFTNGKELHFTKMYGIDIVDYITVSLMESFENFDNHLTSDPDDKMECEQRRIAAIAFYIHNLETLDDVTEEIFQEIFNYVLPKKTIENLCNRLYETNRILDKWIIDDLIELAASSRYFNAFFVGLGECVKPSSRSLHGICHGLCKYLEKNRLWDKYAPILLEKCPILIFNVDNVLQHFIMSDFNCGNVKKGENRIEESYRNACIGAVDRSLKYVFRTQAIKEGDTNYILRLIERHKEISRKKPRYFSNSYEHRLKLRIAESIVYSISKFGSEISEVDEIMDNLWHILLNENNQLNINYIYEYIIGTIDKRKQVFLKKLEEAHSQSSSQQVSVMSALYTCCMSNEDLFSTLERNTIVANLLALTMGANFHTRLFAQMILQALMETEAFNVSQIIQSISIATMGKLGQHAHDDLRHLMYKFNLLQLWDIILFVTNVPYDEQGYKLFWYSDLPSDTLERLNNLRSSFVKKSELSSEEVFEKEIINQIQRKINPPFEVLESSNLMVYPEKNSNNEMFVIASLIDKLPNLGGIARTCEVLGIKNLVMDSKKDVEKNDFKNLSMTAENSLNILEVKCKDLRDFIIAKQREGFAVVGAEQTCNSENFVNFIFPEKCILLLGHEKHGISPNLLGLLDHAVEIPQFGQIRSLNVHVTGALFMWEYCKQRIL
ncbi:uncharacterized protein LOC106089434 isoform X2 [Stomoxys calcitrans]|uniref:uncharacterized protein LOC106089434 isoform X2 n=1 Tax=Stomoxys calcitrans TaxID=35570 RepID=UPI0027E37372|nr:uncharacterized protein LOC106089434 isoform X2 [Stomoxys calcitrans]